MPDPVVVGIDLSLTSTGLCLVEERGIAQVHRVQTKTAGSDIKARNDRLEEIADAVLAFVGEAGQSHAPDLVVIEAPSYGSQHGHQHDRSGLWWRVVDWLLQDGFPLALVSPQGRAKYATGKGNSPKKMVETNVRQRYAMHDVAWPSRGKADDVADAILLAAMGTRWLGKPLKYERLGKANVAALDGVTWPNRSEIAA